MLLKFTQIALKWRLSFIMEEDDFELTAEMKAILDERLQEDEETYLSAEESIKRLSEKFTL